MDKVYINSYEILKVEDEIIGYRIKIRNDFIVMLNLKNNLFRLNVKLKYLLKCKDKIFIKLLCSYIE